VKDPFSLVFKIILLRHSTTRRNNKGARGHPCLNPLPLLKKADGDSLMSSAILALHTHPRTQWTASS